MPSCLSLTWLLLVCVRMWFLKQPRWANHTPHTSHLNGFSPLWLRKCFFKLLSSEKHDPHKSHGNGFSWRFILLLRAQRNSHKSHLKYGFSPVCVRMWSLKLWNETKHNPHTSHLKGFSPVWVRGISPAGTVFSYWNWPGSFNSPSIVSTLVLRLPNLIMMTMWTTQPTFLQQTC